MKVLRILIFLGVLGAAYQYRSVFLPVPPCTEPIPYTLGTFSKEFNISQKYFLDALAEAEAVWEKPSGIDLFAYTPADTSGDVLKINLTYDYRQQATSKLASLGIVVKNTRESYEMLKAKLAALKTDYDKQKSSFNVRLADFNRRQETYGKEVAFWNKKGGAPEAEYDKLNTERIALQAEAAELERIQKKLT